MKSIHHGKIAANGKLRGKKTHRLSCACCVMQNFKDAERIKEAIKEISSFALEKRQKIL